MIELCTLLYEMSFVDVASEVILLITNKSPDASASTSKRRSAQLSPEKNKNVEFLAWKDSDNINGVQ